MKKFIHIFLLACCFAPSFLFMKIAVVEVPPLTLASVRVILAASILFIILKIRGKNLWPYRSYAKHFLIMGIFICALPTFLIASSEKTIPSALAGLITGSTPIFAAIAAHFFASNDQFSPSKMIGILLGVIGLTFLFVPNCEGVFSYIKGATMVLIASVSYGGGMVYSKNYLENLPPLIASTWQLIMATLIFLPLSLLFERPYTLPLPSWMTFASILELSLVGSVFAFILHYQTIKIAKASYLSLCTFLCPLLSLLLGVICLKETLTWNVYVGGGFVLLGLGLSTKLIKWRRGEYEMEAFEELAQTDWAYMHRSPPHQIARRGGSRQWVLQKRRVKIRKNKQET